VVLARKKDTPSAGDGNALLSGRLDAVREDVQAYFPLIDRVSVALYDPQTLHLKTFLSSPRGDGILTHYGVALGKATWLDELRRARRSRVIDDMRPALLGEQPHSRRIVAGGFRSSYTVPVFGDAGFLGFVFFNSRREKIFSGAVTRQLDLFVHIISLLIESALRSVAVLTGGLALLCRVCRFRDDETSEHLSRMSQYSELIAVALAPKFGLDDEWAQYVRLFAPLHDIGKIAVPDAIVFKPGALEPAERDVMRRHAEWGAEILADLIRELRLETMPHTQTLLHIARHHHEAWDGSGYPDGLRGEEIPRAARIVKVADVFDALTSRRCYKPAWPVEAALQHLRRLAGVELDPQCVAAFLQARAQS
jgi:hypothetical protein